MAVGGGAWYYRSVLDPIPKAIISVDAQAMRAVLCPWCADFALAEQWALDHNIRASHDRCEDCSGYFKKLIRCERASRHPFGK